MNVKWIEKLYFGFLLLLPVVFCSSTIDPVLLPRQILLGVFLFIVIVALILKKPELKLSLKTPIFIAFFAFVFLNLIAFFRSDIPGESHATLSKLLLLFTFFSITTALLYNGIIRTSQLVFGGIFFGLITVAFPVFELTKKTLQGEHLLRRIEFIIGFSANKNLLSSILFLCIPFYCIGLLQQKKIRILSLFALIITLSVLVIIRTRAVLIAVSIFFILVLLYNIKQKFSIGKKKFIASGTTLFVLMISALFLYIQKYSTTAEATNENQLSRYLNRLLNSATLESRIEIWKNSMLMWKDNLLLGVGLGNWQVLFPKYGLSNFSEFVIVNGESTLQRPHNDFLWILCETGILGLLAYLGIFGVIFYQLYKLISKATTSTEKWQFYFIFSGLAGYLAISFFDFPYERTEHQTIVMLFFAIVTAAYVKQQPKKEQDFRPLLFVFLIPLGFSFLVTFYRFNGEQHAQKMYRAREAKNWSETLYEAKKANNPFYPLDNSSMPLSWYEGIADFNEKRVEDSEACFERAYQLTPYNIQVIANLASTYLANGKPDEALALYNKALELSSRFDEARLGLAALYFNKKEFDKAYYEINKVGVDSKNPKYETYLAAILNKKINAYLKTATDKAVIDKLVAHVKTKEALLKLYFDAKKSNRTFEEYLVQVQF